MSLGLVGRKVGMTRIFTDDGASIPVTVLDVSNNRVAQIKTPENDGYAAVQVAFGKRRPSRVNKSLAGHLAKAGKLVHEKEHAQGLGPGVRLLFREDIGRLLIEDLEERTQPVQIVRRHADIKRDALFLKPAQVEITGGGGRIDERVGPKLQSRRERRQNTASLLFGFLNKGV